MSDEYSQDGRIGKKFYEGELFRLQEELVGLQRWIKQEGLWIIGFYSGQDSRILRWGQRGDAGGTPSLRTNSSRTTCSAERRGRAPDAHIRDIRDRPATVRNRRAPRSRCLWARR